MKEIKYGISNKIWSETNLGSTSHTKRIKLIDIKDVLRDMEMWGKK